MAKNEAKEILARLRKNEKEGKFPYLPKTRSPKDYMPPTVELVRCVKSSELIKGLHKADEAWSQSTGDLTFGGGANKTLVDRRFYLDIIETALDKGPTKGTKGQLEKLQIRVETLPKDVLIDLDN